MSYAIELTGSARTALNEQLPRAVAVACWEFIRGPLTENRYRVGKQLRDRPEGKFSARRGEFRIVYRIYEHRIVVRVIAIAHRTDVYR